MPELLSPTMQAALDTITAHIQPGVWFTSADLGRAASWGRMLSGLARRGLLRRRMTANAGRWEYQIPPARKKE